MTSYSVKSNLLDYKPTTYKPFADNETLKRIQRESQERTIREQREREQERIRQWIKKIHNNEVVYYSLFYLSWEYKHQFYEEITKNFPNAKLNYCPRWDGTPRYEVFLPIQEAPKLRRYLLAHEWMSCDFSDALDQERCKYGKEYMITRVRKLIKLVYQTRKEYPNACPDFKMDDAKILLKRISNN